MNLEEVMPKIKEFEVEIHSDGQVCMLAYCQKPHTRYKVIYKRKRMEKINEKRKSTTET
jgi:hypothetical protein